MPRGQRLRVQSLEQRALGRTVSFWDKPDSLGPGDEASFLLRMRSSLVGGKSLLHSDAVHVWELHRTVYLHACLSTWCLQKEKD